MSCHIMGAWHVVCQELVLDPFVHPRQLSPSPVPAPPSELAVDLLLECGAAVDPDDLVRVRDRDRVRVGLMLRLRLRLGGGVSGSVYVQA